jgi:uncharacterized membrane protein YfcA
MFDHIIATYGITGLGWIALSLFLTSMSKGGFPVGSIAVPLLVLMWPEETGAARAAVGFMLPMLCLMDLAAFVLYRKYVRWDRIKPMIPGSIAGVALASILFISEKYAVLHVSDEALRIAIGVLGLGFVGWHAAGSWIRRHLETAHIPSTKLCFGYGIVAGICSSLAHAAGPLMQMVLLPQRLPKMQFVATMVAYFFFLNWIKMIPFTFMGRIHEQNLTLGLLMLPVIPIGVLTGFALVRITHQKFFITLVYCALAVTSTFLILNGIRS